MNNAVKIIGWLISIALILFCVIDLASQYKAGEEIRWRVPIIFFGAGIGLPVILFIVFGGEEESIENGTDSEMESHGAGDD